MFVVGVWEWSFSSNVPELGTIQDVYGALKRIEEKMVTREDIEASLIRLKFSIIQKRWKYVIKATKIYAGRVKEVISVSRCWQGFTAL